MSTLTKKYKILLCMLVAILSILRMAMPVYAVVSPTSDFYVNDYANLLSDQSKAYIMDKAVELHDRTSAQVVVATVKSMDGDSVEEYATKLFRRFGIGDKKENNGVLLLVALEERQLRIEVGYGLEGALTDGKCGRIMDDSIVPYLKDDLWDQGIVNGFNSIAATVAAEYDCQMQFEFDGNTVEGSEINDSLNYTSTSSSGDSDPSFVDYDYCLRVIVISVLLGFGVLYLVSEGKYLLLVIFVPSYLAAVAGHYIYVYRLQIDIISRHFTQAEFVRDAVATNAVALFAMTLFIMLGGGSSSGGSSGGFSSGGSSGGYSGGGGSSGGGGASRGF